jgi:hypothetical protein
MIIVTGSLKRLPVITKSFLKRHAYASPILQRMPASNISVLLSSPEPAV